MKRLFMLYLALILNGVLSAQEPFITTWKTDNTTTNSSCNTCITIPTYSDEIYNYDVDWDGDGVYDEFNLTGDAWHNYEVTGTYTIALRGTFPGIHFDFFDGEEHNFFTDRLKILSIEQWGDIVWMRMDAAFSGAGNFVYNATDLPNLSNIMDMSYMFYFTSSFDGSLNDWNVSNVINMNGMFREASSFNSNLNNWDVSNVSNMYGMFLTLSALSSFNGDLSGWDVSNVINMYGMFRGATSFNGNLSTWDVSSVTNMQDMFRDASSFNSNLNNWNVSNVTSMKEMFYNATSFNSSLGVWDITNVNGFTRMLSNSGLSTKNYDNTLIGWVSQSIESNRFLGADSLTYCLGETARNTLINDHGWDITGDVLDCTTTSFFTTKEDNLIQVYPNPTQDVLYLDLGQIDKTVDIHIIDVLGHHLQQISTSDTIHTMDISHLISGQYFLCINQGIQSKILRFIKK